MAFEPVLARHLSERGVDVAALTDTPIFSALGPQDRLYTLARAGRGALDDDLLALTIARRTPLRAFGNLAHVLLGAASLHDMLAIILRYMRLFQNRPRRPAQLVGEGELVELRYEQPAVLPEFPGFVVDLFFASCLDSLQHVGGADPGIFCLELRHRPIDEERYRHAVGVEVRFGATMDRLIAPRAAMMARFAGLSPAQQPVHAALAARILDAQAAEGGDLAAEVRALIGHDPARPASARVLATSLAMSERTLRRRLAAEGHSLSDLADEVRAGMARSYVCSLPTATVADALGFHDASTFSRSFRRWTGMTPASFRRMHAPQS